MKKGIIGIGMLFVLFMVTSVSAQTGFGFYGVGGEVGYVNPDFGESTIAFGGRADLGTIVKPNLGIVAELLYWSKGYDSGYYSWSYSSFYINALGKWSFGAPGAKLNPYAAAGLGMVFGKSKSEYSGPTYGYALSSYDTDVSNTDIVIHILGGASYLLSANLAGFAEFRYTLGGWDMWGIFVGVMYGLK